MLPHTSQETTSRSSSFFLPDTFAARRYLLFESSKPVNKIHISPKLINRNERMSGLIPIVVLDSTIKTSG